MSKRISRFLSTEKFLKTYLLSLNRKVFSQEELAKIFDDNRSAWGIAVSTSTNKLIDRYVMRGVFRHVIMPGSEGEKSRYFFGEPNIYEISTSLRSKSYISHYTAMSLNDLTDQIPKTIYTAVELSQKNLGKSSLTQEAIDSAFDEPQRRSLNTVIFNDFKIILLNSKYSGGTGIMKTGDYNITSLERTILDCTVRPQYAGGCFSVLEGYRRALKLKMFSVNKLLSLLNKMDFIYPYEQAVGFYLEKAGYQGKLLQILVETPKNYRFYLDYGLTDKEFNQKWQIFHPTGM